MTLTRSANSRMSHPTAIVKGQADLVWCRESGRAGTAVNGWRHCSRIRLSTPDDDTENMSMDIPEDIRAFLEQPRLCVMATLNRDGSPQLTTMWYDLIDDLVVLNTTRG